MIMIGMSDSMDVNEDDDDDDRGIGSIDIK